jgi:hypothetical protein
MGMREAGERQPEVIEPMIEPFTGDRDARASLRAQRLLAV